MLTPSTQARNPNIARTSEASSKAMLRFRSISSEVGYGTEPKQYFQVHMSGESESEDYDIVSLGEFDNISFFHIFLFG